MAATEQALRHAEAYRAQLLQYRQTALSLLADSWPPASASQLGQWVQYSARVLEHYQGLGARLASNYIAAVESAELRQAIAAAPVNLADYAGTTRGGIPLQAAIATTVDRTTRAAQAAGYEQRDVTRMALQAAQRNVAYELLATPDEALTDLMGADGRIRGWRRIARPGACGACLAAANGQIRPAGEEIERHPHCQCIQELIVAGVQDRFRPPTGQELFDGLTPAAQDALFYGRGGAAKADLIRSGDVPLSALITRAPRGPDRPDVITETPLAALTQR